MEKYKERGVSAKKEDVFNALKNKIDSGIYPNAFCKIVEDYLGNDENYCNVIHVDGVGTKSSLAYIYYKETGDISVFKNLVMDSIVMNTDDLLCIGCYNNFLLSNTIGRNPNFISGEVIKTIIHAYNDIIDWFNNLGIKIILTGGETEDVADIVRTLILFSSITTRLKKEEIITNEKIKPGQVIIGFSSSGKANYEDEYNSGIGSNGLTSARHDLFNKIYKIKYPESFNPYIKENLSYCGPYKLTDTIPELAINIGKAALSPTRTYIPILIEIFKKYKPDIGGIVHCTGGGQIKCLRFGKNVHYIKNNLFDIPKIFELIKNTSNTSYKEMYKVFNMGHRLELYIDEKFSEDIINISKSFGVDAKIIGEIKENDKNKLTIKSPEGIIEYQ